MTITQDNNIFEELIDKSLYHYSPIPNHHQRGLLDM